MIGSMALRRRAALVVLCAAAACSDRSDPATAPKAVGGPLFRESWEYGPYYPEPNLVKVCSFGVDANSGIVSTYAVLATLPSVVTPQWTMDLYSCRTVWQGSANATVTLTHLPPSNGALDRIVVLGGMNEDFRDTVTSGTTAQVTVDPAVGAVFWVKVRTHTPVVTLPQGCTPGYWRQRQHFGQWAAPYRPNALFSEIFNVGRIPGLRLRDAVRLTGGGINALRRHTVAALLNAASPAVHYPLSVQEVIAEYNAAVLAGTFRAQKDRFATFNELGCPLARRP
jgi:hypothetical protein